MYRFHDRSKQRGNQLCVLEATLEIVKWPGERPVLSARASRQEIWSRSSQYGRLTRIRKVKRNSETISMMMRLNIIQCL